MSNLRYRRPYFPPPAFGPTSSRPDFQVLSGSSLTVFLVVSDAHLMFFDYYLWRLVEKTRVLDTRQLHTDSDSDIGARLQRHNLLLTSVADYCNGLIVQFDRFSNLVIDKRQQLLFHVTQCALIDRGDVQLNRLTVLRWRKWLFWLLMPRSWILSSMRYTGNSHAHYDCVNT